MKLNYFFTLVLTSLLSCSALSETKVAKLFSVRTESSSAKEFQDFISRSSLMSFVEYQQSVNFQARSYNIEIDEALLLTTENPIVSYQKLDQIVRDIYLHLLTKPAQELAASLLLRMSTLNIPERMQLNALDRLSELVADNKDLLDIPEYKKISLQKNQKRTKNSDLLQKEYLLRFKRLKENPALDDALVLKNGQPFDSTNSSVAGNSQWALISNTYAPLLVFGTLSDFWKALDGPTAFEPLTSGNCKSAKLISNAFELQTQAIIFSSTACSTEKNADQQISSQQHLAKMPEIQEDKKNYLLTAVTIIGLGLAYTLKDKSVTLHVPGFR